MPTRRELIAFNKTEKEVAAAIGADFVLYQSLEDLKRACRDAALCRSEEKAVMSRWTGARGVRVRAPLADDHEAFARYGLRTVHRRETRTAG